MKIGIGKEIKTDERRVGITATDAKTLISDGNQVYFEPDAGVGSGMPDDAYQEVGAVRVSKKDMYATCDMIVKVKEPQPSEFELLRPDQILFTYLHLDGNQSPAYARQLANTGCVGIAFEWVEDENGRHPLLDPMSDITGAIFAVRSIALLMTQGGRLVGSYINSTSPSTAMVVGLGRIGRFATKVLLMNGFNVCVVDKTPDTVIERIFDAFGSDDIGGWSDRVSVVESLEEDPAATQHRIETTLTDTDILIMSAVRRPTLPESTCKHLITRQMLKMMRPGSVVCDATASVRDMIETCVPSEELEKTYLDEGLIHYNPDHIPSLTPVTSTKLLADATFPYVAQLAQYGWRGALIKNANLRRGLMTANRCFFHEYTVQRKGLKLTPYRELLGNE